MAAKLLITNDATDFRCGGKSSPSMAVGTSVTPEKTVTLSDNAIPVHDTIMRILLPNLSIRIIDKQGPTRPDPITMITAVAGSITLTFADTRIDCM
ncbi:unnamed protein product [Heterotrigona itama]|uniref:Uncharacterized protein n=1 Tax=Heterotrigona itama TaxID=395501 RepID=A0A6V7HDV7_9HYME|nr:unnamed protein product [Heterotrigona itama]